MMKTLALLAIVLTANLQAQVWMEQYLLMGVEEIQEEVAIEEAYLPLNSQSTNI